jgi:EAL domain-containing protein (putative c-di-GMP-specific phosphodiesterase class I)
MICLKHCVLTVFAGKIVGAEALLRWEHFYGTQPTGRFIPIAEESGLIVGIGAWALRHVARFAVRVNRDARIHWHSPSTCLNSSFVVAMWLNSCERFLNRQTPNLHG